MRLLVCFKIVPDLEKLSEQDWIVNDKNTVDVSFVQTGWNCFDESALEMMLKLSDLSESFIGMYELSALTIGNEQCDSYLRVLYSLGYKKAVRINNFEDIRFWPELVSAAIVSYVKNRGNQSVIVMGRQSADGDNSKTPLLTAELLGWPCVTQVIKMEPVDEKHLKIYSMGEYGVLIQVLKIPFVAVVGDTPNSYLRVPTLKARMKLGKQPIEYLNFEELGINIDDIELSPDLEVMSIKKIDNDRHTLMITGDTPEEKAEKLYHTYLKGRLKQ